MEALIKELMEIRMLSISTAVNIFDRLVKTEPNLRGIHEGISIQESELGILVSLEEENFNKKAFISFVEVDNLIESQIEFDGGIYRDHLLEIIPDIILEELERWRDSVKSVVLVQEVM